MREPSQMFADGEGYSVVVPVYNSRATLRELHARLTEVMTELAGADGYEIVFVDDAGPEDCWSILSELADLDPRVRALQLMRNAPEMGRANGSVWVVFCARVCQWSFD